MIKHNVRSTDGRVDDSELLLIGHVDQRVGYRAKVSVEHGPSGQQALVTKCDTTGQTNVDWHID